MQEMLFSVVSKGGGKYAKIDNYVSRSAQPQKEDFKWLRADGC